MSQKNVFYRITEHHENIKNTWKKLFFLVIFSMLFRHVFLPFILIYTFNRRELFTMRYRLSSGLFCFFSVSDGNIWRHRNQWHYISSILYHRKNNMQQSHLFFRVNFWIYIQYIGYKPFWIIFFEQELS